MAPARGTHRGKVLITIMNPSFKNPLFASLMILPLAACDFPDKVCIGDCADDDASDSSGAESDSVGHSTLVTDGEGDTDEAATDDPADDTDSGDTEGVFGCAIEDSLPPGNCLDQTPAPGEVCFELGAGGQLLPIPFVSAVAGPFDEIGGADLMVTHPDGSITALLDTPEPGAWHVAGTYEAPFPGESLVLTDAGDLDGDGVFDAVGKHGDEYVVLIKDEGSMTIDPTVIGTVVFGPEIVDWNADGIPDLVMILPPGPSENVIVIEGDGSGDFTESPQFGFSADALAYAVGRLGPGAGEDDFVFAPPEGDLDVMISAPGDTFVHVPLGPTALVKQIEIAELDGDDRGDVVVLYEDTATGFVGLQVLLQGVDLAGDPTFAATLYSPGCKATTFALGDVDGDGAIDIVTGGGADNAVGMWVRLGDGLGGFARVTHRSLLGGASALYIADFSGDGVADIAGPELSEGYFPIATATP